MRTVGRTDIGKVRDENEDAYLADEQTLVVADGMGGYEAGGTAARLAISEVEKHLYKPLKRARSNIAAAFVAANNAVRKAGVDLGYSQMGTTLTLALVQGDIAWIGHVGDSRAYLLCEGSLRRLTNDHSLVGELVRQGKLNPEEARVHPRRNVITQAIGSRERVKPDIFSIALQPGDRLILCTDGLTTGVDDDQIAALASPENSPDEAADNLIRAAKKAGGADNITVVIGDQDEKAPVKRGYRFMVPIVVVAAAVLGLATADYALSQNYYLSSVNGRVAINRGLPGGAAGYRFGRLEKLTAIRVRDLPGYFQKRLERRMVVGGDATLAKTMRDIERMAVRR